MMYKKRLHGLMFTAMLFAGGIPSVAQQIPYKNSKLPVEERISDLMDRMTIDDKIAQIRHLHSWQVFDDQTFDENKLKESSQDMCWGFVEGFTLTSENCKKNMRLIQEYMVEKTRLGIPVFCVTESLHGTAQDGSTIFPQNVALASTFNLDFAYRKAAAISDDLHAVGMKQVLAPCIDVVRDLRWGRVEETFGEDPLLCGLFGIAEVNGYLDHGISPMLKHFGPHGNPMSGLNLASVPCGLRDVREVYMKPFEMVIRNTGIAAVMSTYNSWNQVPNSASHFILTELLRDEYGFKGYVYSDWGSISMLKDFHHTAKDDKEAAYQAFSAGLDAEASSTCYRYLKELINEGRISMETLNESVRRVLYAKFTTGLFDDPYGDKYADSRLHSKESVKLSKEIADESVVLLKNENNLLPLNEKQLKDIAVIGPNADQVQFGDYSWSRDNKDGITPLQGIRNRLGDKVNIHYAKGCDLVSLNTDGFREAAEAAQKSDVAVIFCGSASASLARDYKHSTCGEGFDLTDLNLTGAQRQLVKEVYKTGKPVVLVLVTGRPFSILWEKEHLPAILVQWYAGEQAGNSIADILFGKVSPSGRLTYSFPRSVGHLPVYYNHLPTDRGFYNHPGSYEKPGRDYVFETPEPLWAFGYGLTYTSFDYKNLKVDKKQYNTGDTIHVSVDVTNTGKRSGKEVVQLYVHDMVSSIVTPVKELRDFNKVEIKPGSTRKVNLKVAVNDLYLLNAEYKRVVEPGEFEILVGPASNEILLKDTIGVGNYAQGIQQEEVKLKKSTQQISIRGEVRDMQATVADGVSIYTYQDNQLLGTTDKQGRFNLKTGNFETLVFKKKGYQDIIVQVNNKKVLNLIIKNKN